MAKFSVKKPLTVFVVVLAIVVLGVVAYLKMTPDLLPNMDFPYVVIVTTDPGASPESVEEEITRPMEQSMATLDQIKAVTSTSQNSVSMVMLEFEDGVNMDTISVDIQQKISVLQGQWNDTVGAPYVLKINPSMIPVMVAAVSQEGKDVYALSDLVTDELTGKLEGVTGVASVTVSGALTRQAHVILDQEKMEALSAKLADAVKAQLKKAEGKLYAAKQQVEDGEKALSDAKRAAADGVAGAAGNVIDEVYDHLKDIYGVLEDTDIGDIAGGIITDPDGTLKELQKNLETLQKSLRRLMKDLESGRLRAEVEGDVSDLLVQLMDGITQMTGAELQLSEAKTQIESGLKQIQEAYKKVDEQTDLGGLLSISTVSGLLTAQNFSMPAGYLKEDGVNYMVSVGDSIDTRQDLEDLVLFDLGMDGIDPIRMKDVADVAITDNSSEIYDKLNGKDGVIVSLNKQSTYATAEVSTNINSRFRELEAEYEGLSFVPLMDQGDYIYLIINSILSSLGWGALFSERFRDKIVACGYDPDELIDVFGDITDEALEGRPEDMVITTHMCKGNFMSHWLYEGTYETIARRLLAIRGFDGFFLEYDSDRAGGFEPLRYIGKQKVVLGLVTSKSPVLEDKATVIARIREAARYIPLDRLSLSPQCGFASCEIGNKLTDAEQWAKIDLVREISEEVWG